jgi:hypothetical protein
MSRTLSSNLLTALTISPTNLILMADLILDSGPIYISSYTSDLIYNGHTYLGKGVLLGIGEMQDTEETKSANFTMSLSGIPSNIVSEALAEQYQGRRCTVYLGAMTNPTSGAPVLIDAFVLFSGMLDTMTIEDGPDTATVTVSVENRLVRMMTSKERRYNDQDQRIDFPNDNAFKYIAALQGQQTEWGRTS